MFLLEIAIISIIVGLIRKGNIKNFFIGGLRGWYIFLVSIILFLSQKVLALAGVTALNDYAFWITIAAYILLFIGLFLNLEGIWAYALLVGALINFVIIVLNGGLMPVSESALNIAMGDAATTYITNFSATMSVATDSTIFLWRYLGAIIPLPLPSIFAEVLTPGTIIMAIASFGFIQSIMTTEYMDEDEYEQYMKELSSEDKKDAPLLDDVNEEKEDIKPSDDNMDYTSMKNDDDLFEENNNALNDNESEDVNLDNELEELSNEEPEDETDYFADFDLEDLRDDEDENNDEDLSQIEEEGAKLEDEDLLKELEDEFNSGEEELFNEDDSLDSLIDDALSEDELDNEENSLEPEDETEEEPEEIEVDDEDDFDIPFDADTFNSTNGLTQENQEQNKDSDLEDLLTEALGDDEEDEEIEELLNELRSLSEDETLSQEENITEQNLADESEDLDIESEDTPQEEVDYDFFKDEDDNEIEEVTNEDLSEAVEYKEDEKENEILKDEEDEVSTEEPIVASSNNIQDAKEFLNKVGKQKAEKTANPVNPMPDVDVDSPFIITDGRIVENPYYKFKKGKSARREEAVSSPEIDDNGIYVMSSGSLAKVKGGKVQPEIPPKEETKTPIKKTNIPNMTYTPSFDKEEEKEEKEQYTPITTKLEKDEERKQNSAKIQTKNYTPTMPMDNPYDNEKQEEQTSKPKRKFRRYAPTSESLEREPNMTIINDSSTGRTIKRDSRYPREEVLPTHKESMVDENGKEVPNPYEKVEMKIGDVEIKFWKKDNQ